MDLNDFILKFSEQFDETDVNDFTGDTHWMSGPL